VEERDLKQRTKGVALRIGMVADVTLTGVCLWWGWESTSSRRHWAAGKRSGPRGLEERPEAGLEAIGKNQ
jgi:hypothetical protein